MRIWMNEGHCIRYVARYLASVSHAPVTQTGPTGTNVADIFVVLKQSVSIG